MVTIMLYDINTISELVEALGGPTKLAHEHGVTASNISNWSLRGFIPPSWHFRLYLALRERGLTVNPDLLEMTPEQYRIAFPRKKTNATVAA